VTCQVIISDYLIERRMSYLLDANDFAMQIDRGDHGDTLLSIFQGHPFFDGCSKWSDLDIMHFHALIVNMLKISAEHSDKEVADKNHPTVLRLTFFFCSMISLLQSRTGSIIDLLRVNRVGQVDVLYDYSARLDIGFAVPRPINLRVVIDNEKRQK
jgi:hypothetical protein